MINWVLPAVGKLPELQIVGGVTVVVAVLVAA
jgi:hypothetical protein